MKLGFMSSFVKASADALHLVPAVNAVIDGAPILTSLHFALDYIMISDTVSVKGSLPMCLHAS